jgi:translocon-associated protein subunit alpha
MHRSLRKLLFLGVVALLIASVVLADVIPEEDGAAGDEGEDMYAAGEAPVRTPSVSRAYFLNASSQSFPSFPAGSKANVVVAFQNNEEASQVVFLIAGLLQPPQQFQTTLQNFSVVRQARRVKTAETVSMLYTFTPDARLEPGEYNMVLGLYVQDASSNQTYFITAFNSSVMIADPLGTDPRTILTYFTLLAIFGGVAYVIADKTGIVKMIKAASHAKSSSSGSNGSKTVEVGTSGTAYDPAYVNAEHQRYRDQIMREKSSSPHSHRASSSKKKN